MVKVYVPTPEAKIRWDGFLISACEVLTALKHTADDIAITSGDPDLASWITWPLDMTLKTLQRTETAVKQRFDQ